MQPTPRDKTYYGQIYIPQHAVNQARERFPLFCQGKTDAEIRRILDEKTCQSREQWQGSRRPGEFVVPIETPDEGNLYPLITPSNRDTFEWAIVSVMTERMRNSWNVYPPEMPNPKLIMAYVCGNGIRQYIDLESEDAIAETILAVIEKGASRTSIEIYRQVPYALTGKTKR
jgi:hypothetical protein